VAAQSEGREREDGEEGGEKEGKDGRDRGVLKIRGREKVTRRRRGYVMS